MIILGLHSSFSAMNHDPSATLMINGKIVSALEEERLNRVKTSLGYFPSLSVKTILKQNSLTIKDVDLVVSTGVSRPDLKNSIERYLNYFFGFSPKIELMHHALAHIYGAYFSSGFDNSLIISIDFMGDGISTVVAEGKNDQIREIYRSGSGGVDESLGSFYAAFTNYLGLPQCEGEFKMMGMSAYGKNKYDLNDLISVQENPFKINVHPNLTINRKWKLNSAFEPCTNYNLLQKKKLPYNPSTNKKFKQEHFDLAHSAQKKYEEIFIKIIKKFKGTNNNICLAGGCALNCLANSHLQKYFENIYVMPAASDRGLSIGSAYFAANKYKQKIKPLKNMFLGENYTTNQIKKFLKQSGIKYTICNSNKDAAKNLSQGKIVGWFKGRSEFGPRALGARSILAHAKIKGIKDKINSKIKFREKYRPYAPVTLATFAKKHGVKKEFPYMTVAMFPNKKFSKELGDAVHKDGSTRLQTVSDTKHPLYSLLKEVEKKTSPVLINTSFNISGEPIVESPRDALRTFFSSGIDVLYFDNIKVDKK